MPRKYQLKARKNIKVSGLVDGHVHTKLCHHAIGEMEEWRNTLLTPLYC